MSAALAALRWVVASPARALATLAGMAIVALVVRGELLQRKLDRAQAEIRELRIDSLNFEARMDTTRALFRDSLAGYARMVEQLQVVSHPRLARSGREASARADLALHVVELQDVAGVASPVQEDTLGIRTAQLTLDSTPFHVTADIALPPPPAPARATWSAWIDPIDLTLELACEGPAATAEAVTPPWVDLTFTRIQESADVCNPPVRLSSGRRWVGWDVLEGAAIGGTAGGVAAGNTKGAVVGALSGVLLRLFFRAF